MENSFDIYSHTVCASNGDIPGWMFYGICALPFALVLLDILGGAK